MNVASREYIGRFAPSPTGPLHYGSLLTAAASYLDARHMQGQWLVRIEDLDPPRESPEAPSQIMSQLEAYGLEWDGEVLFQSSRLEAYREVLDSLSKETFACRCSRKSTPAVYPGTCRNLNLADTETALMAIRLKVPDEPVQLDDRICGRQVWSPKQETGDFIVKRRDGLFAYQLAVVVDDIFQDITDVVRGRDLMESTPRQICLYRALNTPLPEYAHLPVVVDSRHDKLSKQSHAMPIPVDHPLPVLHQILRDLGQLPITGATNARAFLQEAAQGWDLSRVPKTPEIQVPAGFQQGNQI